MMTVFQLNNIGLYFPRYYMKNRLFKIILFNYLEVKEVFHLHLL